MKTSIIPCVVVFITLLTSSIASAAGLDLDRSFAPMLRYSNGVDVLDIVVQPDGKYIAVGKMSLINNRQVNSIARFNADGSLDSTFDAGGSLLSLQNNTLALQPDGKIIVAGNFAIAGGLPRFRMARLNADGSLDPSFNVTTILPNQSFSPTSLVVQPDGKIIAVGVNFQVGSSTYTVARLNPDGSVDSSFVPFSNSSSSLISKVYFQPDGKLIFVGTQMIVGGQTRIGIVRLNSDGTLDTSFNVALNVGGTINAASILPDGKIMIGGTFSTVNGQARENLTRLNGDGSLDASFGSNPARRNGIQKIGYQTDGKIIYAENDAKIYRDNADGSPDADFVTRSRILYDARAFAVLPDNRIIVGGNIEFRISTSPADFSTRFQPLVMLAADGTLNDEYRPNVLYTRLISSAATDIAVQPDGKVLIGSDDLYSDSGTMANYNIDSLARFNPDGTFDSTFVYPRTYLTGGSRVTQVEVLPDGKILLGTYSANGNKAVFRLNADGTPDTSFGNVTIGGLDKKILGLLVQTDGKILIRGSFTQIQGQPRAFFARLNADGTLDTGFNPILSNDAGSTSSAIIGGMPLQPDRKIVVTGNFTKVNGATQKWQVRLNADGSLDPSLISSPNNEYDVLLSIQPDGKQIRTIRGTMLRYNSNGTLDATFTTRLTFYRESNTTGVVYGAIPLANGKIFIYGDFNSVNLGDGLYVDTLGFAVLNADGSLDRSSIAERGADNSFYLYAAKMANDGKIYIAGGFSFINEISQPAFARLNAYQPKTAAFDFDGDGKSDASVFRSGNWYINPSSAPNGFYGVQFGLSSDKLAPADYDGDGKTDVAVWRESEGNFYILNSSNNSVRVENFGLAGDVLTVGDWDGDGKADLATYREGAQSCFFYRGSFNNPNGNITYLPWGISGDKATRGDFDGDGKLDAGVFRPSNQTWYIRQSSDNQIVYRTFGLAMDKRVSGDFDGDGKTDITVFRDGVWYIRQSSNNQIRYQNWGLNTDTLAPADFDGDGKTDVAVWRNGIYYILNSSNSAISYRYFGVNGDKVIASAFVE